MHMPTQQELVSELMKHLLDDICEKFQDGLEIILGDGQTPKVEIQSNQNVTEIVLSGDTKNFITYNTAVLSDRELQTIFTHFNKLIQEAEEE